MAQTVTAAFRAAWAKKSWLDARYRVYWKRRYWSTAVSPAAYVLESAWAELPRRWVHKVHPIPQALDGDRESRYEITAFVIEVANELNQWIESVNAPSVFAADGTAELGYIAAGAEVKVEFGLKLADGTWEYVPVFLGVVTSAPVIRSDSPVAELELESRARYFLTDAEVIHTVVTDEAMVPAAGDGTTQDFLTTSRGVREVLNEDGVKLDAVGQDPGEDNDYTVSGIGENGPATVHFNTAPGVGVVPTWSGSKWRANITVETLAELACDAAGIAEADREIEPVVFPGGLSGSKSVDTQAEWEAGGTLQNIDTDSAPGSIRRLWHKIDDFEDGDYTADPVWAAGGTGWSVVSGVLTGASPSHSIILTGVTLPKVGTRSFEMVRSSGYIQVELFGQSGFYIPESTHPHSIVVRYDGSFLSLLELDKNGTTVTEFATANMANPGYINVSVDADGNIKVYTDGSSTVRLEGAITLSEWAAVFRCNTSGGGTLDDVYFSDATERYEAPSAAAVVYESQEYDLLAAPTAWGTLDYSETLNGGTIAYKTAVASASGGPYDAWVAIDSSTRTIQSALKQYLKVQITITPAASIGDVSSPEVDEWVANFTTTSVFISIANLAGLNLWDALERYAAPPGYAIGCRSDGKFFLRRKATAPTSTVTINQENAVVKVLEYDPGDKRVVNAVYVRYADQLSTYDGDAAGEAAPTSEQRYGRRAKSENLDGVIYANDVNMGDARAQTVYEARYQRARRWRMKLWLVPWLELMDGLTLSYYDDPILRQSLWGDPLVKWGSDRLAFGEAQNVLARDQLVRLLGWTPDLEEPGESEALVEEVLA